MILIYKCKGNPAMVDTSGTPWSIRCIYNEDYDQSLVLDAGGNTYTLFSEPLMLTCNKSIKSKEVCQFYAAFLYEVAKILADKPYVLDLEAIQNRVKEEWAIMLGYIKDVP